MFRMGMGVYVYPAVNENRKTGKPKSTKSVLVHTARAKTGGTLFPTPGVEGLGRGACGRASHSRRAASVLVALLLASILDTAISFSRPRLACKLFASGCIFLLTYLDIRNRFANVKKRTTVWLPLDLIERLKKLSRKTGAPMAELFRRAVEAYVRRQT
jgi:hypothetical protein